MSADDQLNAELRRFRRSSWRWECQGDYAVDQRKIQRWRDGLPPDGRSKAGWLAYVRDIREQGKTFDRVRRLTDPLTEYLAWMLEQTQVNVDAGEDIRWVRPDEVGDLDLPDYDFYLFDDDRLVIMHFDDGKLLADLDIVTAPDVVARHRQYRDLVWSRAVPHAEYIALRGT